MKRICTLFVSLVIALLGCARSAVPSLDPDALTAPALPGLSPRAIDVRVLDERPVSAEDRAATERVVADALGRVLGRRGVSVEPEAEHRLLIRVQQPLGRSDQVDPSSCIEVQSEFAVRGIRSPASKFTRCSTWSYRGTRVGSGVIVFEETLDNVLGQLDSQLAAVLEHLEPPRFDPDRIESPSFGWLEPREVALVINDQLSPDGASGTSLERALENVFQRSGVRRTPDAGYRLAWSLRRPAEPRSGEAPACVALSVEAHDGQTTFRSGFETCAGPSERLVTEILGALNAQGEAARRVPSRRASPRPAQPRRTPTKKQPLRI